jgi:glutamyl-Q tRNA(Asp) synthetase
MDDLDPPREQAGAADIILRSLECHGLYWDEEVLWQSRRSAAYEDALAKLAREHQTFYCDCSRKRLSPAGACRENCRARQNRITTPRSTRITVPSKSLVEFDDLLQGRQSTLLDGELENFAVKRRDGLYAYQLAVVVDDANQGISHIVRGSDLMDSTARQIYLQRALGQPTPGYCHLPIITNDQGQKFSKQHCAPFLLDTEAAQNLRRALAFLHQATPPGELTDPESVLSFARQQWSMDRVPGVRAIRASSIV